MPALNSNRPANIGGRYKSIFRFSAVVVLTSFIAHFPSAQVAVAQPSEASETVKSTVEKVRATVTEEQGKTSPEALDGKLREIIAPVFDFEEMARRSLGANWRKASADEQEQFVDLFSDLLARNYLKKIRENVAESDFRLDGETSKGEKSLVKTIVQFEGEPASIDYRMMKKQGRWKVYDVVIENIGLVSNYRSEFAGIVSKEGISGLLQRLREKQ
ncbi:MAG: ABC transporter substrate-binding protein [Bdellovibrionales bacterium]|nr:ABC transporter substrate-binding protein [Bdellovibrionales bacterium]